MIFNDLTKTKHKLFILLAIVAGLSMPMAQAAGENESEFLKAAFSGKSEAIKPLLEKGVNVNHQNEMGFTALIIASQFGHADRAPGCARHRAHRSIRRPMRQSSCD